MKHKRVAILGMSFRLPGSKPADFWPSLMAGKSLVTGVAPERWSQAPFLHPQRANRGTSYTFAAGSIGDIYGFDAGFFGISPREAAHMDPQQRLLLEMSWESFENAGVVPSTLRGSACGVYIGISSSDYSLRFAEDMAAMDSTTATGTTPSIAANRLSYVFDLRGPSMAIDTACSSSLVAFHLACRAIVGGECTTALAGGISLHLHPYGFVAFSKASMLSRRGVCNVFDQNGDGYVRSEGGGIFLLKDYDQAVADGDHISAVVPITMVNSDGRKSGLTVPSVDAQAMLLRQAYSAAGISPLDIDYIEAHGTGTAVGDPIETHALGNALGRVRPSKKPLLIGSVKSNLGHLEAASGVAGLIKALHCIEHRMVPATIGIETPNPNIKFDDWNIEVATTHRKLKEHGKLVVGVNSFGFGGANAHVILESYEPPRSKPPKHHQAAPLPIVLSARDATGLKVAAREFAAFLSAQPPGSLYDIAYNAAYRREWHEHRAIVYGTSPADVARCLTAFADESGEPHGVESGAALEAPSGPAFVYSGNGSQWEGMGKRLLTEEPVFREAVREVDALFRQHAGHSLEAELAGEYGPGRFEFTEYSQPALFAVQVGITRMLRHRGIRLAAVAGHSVGEVAAAWASGALPLAAAVAVIYHRSRLQGGTKGQGAMTAVGLGETDAQALLAELGLTQTVSLAGVNSSRGVALAGEASSLSQVEAVLNERNIFQRRLDLDYAFHSPAMDSIEAGIKQALAHLRPGKSHLPFYSTVTGGKIDGTALDDKYWWHNIRKPVLFEQATRCMIDDGLNMFIEIGPHAVLRGYVNDCLRDAAAKGRFIPTLARGDDAAQRVWSACNQFTIASGVAVLQSAFPWTGRFVRLPNYPWQRERYLQPVTPESSGLMDRRAAHPLLGYALPHHELTWENLLDTQLQPTLADHVVGHAAVFPSTGFSEIVLAGAMQWQPAAMLEIEELEILAPLVFDGEHTQILRTHIDKQDGRITVSAREHMSAGAWTLHAVGRILREPQRTLLEKSALEIPARAPEFSGADQAALTKAASLDYGPAYQCIDHGWVIEHTALAVLRTPQSVAEELEHMHVHPAFLDCTFQLIIQLLKAEVYSQGGIAYLPTKIGRLRFCRDAGKPHFARARVLHRTPHSLSAEFAIFDKDGGLVCEVREARFRSVRLSKNASDRLRFLNYHGVAKPHPLAESGEPPVSNEAIHTAMSELARRSVLAGNHRRHAEEVDPLLDSLCSRFTRQALLQLADDAPKLSLEKIANLRAATPGIEPYLDHLIAAALEDQTLVATDGGWEVAADGERQPSAEDIWNSLVADYPDYFQIIHSVGRVGLHLYGLLQGTTALAQVRPRESSIGSLTNQVLGAASKQRIENALRTLIAQALRNLAEGARLAVLEISEQAPGFAVDICVSMDVDRCDYRFATTSETAIEDAQRLTERFPAIETRLMAPNAPDSAPTPDCHIAILTLDFGKLDDALYALDYARSALRPNGTLLVIGQHPSRWMDFVFGAERGNWTQSQQGKWLSNQRNAAFWLQALRQPAFTTPELLEFSPDTLSGPYLMLSKRLESSRIAAPPEKTTPCSWVLLADGRGFCGKLSDRLTALLQGRGDMVVQAVPDSNAQLEKLLTRTTKSYGQLDGIIYLAASDGQPPMMEPPALLDTQVDHCATVAQIVRACDATLTQTHCWLVTAHATDFTPLHGVPVPSLPVDSALWGYGRTLLNEAAQQPVTLIDLADTQSVEACAAALMREITHPDDEQEIAIGHNGARFVPRLRTGPRPQAASPKKIETPTIQLGFAMPGQLRNLRWEAVAGRQPAEGEVEVEVRATGLNFRDVMYALGLLSDEAIENGFAGPTLGLEFAGVVQRVGAKANGFAPGDQVVGFGPSSFGNRVVTQIGAISHIPSGISFEAAATIPSAFFTVYYALHHLAQIEQGEKVLIHGAAGGVGIAAIQVAKAAGAEIFATAGSDEKRDFLRLLGVEHIFDSRSLAFTDEILAATDGKGVDIVLNSLAGEAINRNFRVLKPFGRFLELGKRDFYENTKIGLRPFRNNISYFGIDADQLMQTRPELTGRLFAKLMTLFKDGVLHPLPFHVFDAENIVDAFRYMQQSRQIGKIVITYRNGISHVMQPEAAAKTRLALSADATYLVTGGLGGFGLKTAQWLVERGARHLVLLGRRGRAAEEAKPVVAELEHQGVRIWAEPCDVTDRQAVSAVLQEVAATFPPLKGVIHAATVIEDGLIRNLDAAKIRSVLAPKILGAQHLHDLTQELALDHFVLFSSATTLFGNPGQGSYVAANTYLEALARHRRARGLPATCVGWGAIDDVGFLARNEKIKTALQGRMGGGAIHSSVALDVLESMLLADHGGAGVMEIDWNALSRFLPSAATPKFSELARHADEGDQNEDNSNDIHKLLLELSDSELVATFTDMLKMEVGEILRVAPDKIDPNRSIFDMGLDSLMGVELGVAVESRFGVRLPVMAISQSPTIAKLAERIIQQLKGGEAQEPVSAQHSVAAQAQQVASQHGAEASAESISRLAEEIQSTNGGATRRLIR